MHITLSYAPSHMVSLSAISRCVQPCTSARVYHSWYLYVQHAHCQADRESSYWLAVRCHYHAEANYGKHPGPGLTVGAPAAAVTPQPASASGWRRMLPRLCTPGTWHHINGVSHRLLQGSAISAGFSGGAARRVGAGQAAQLLGPFYRPAPKSSGRTHVKHR
jgi:hypothetical protein